MNAAVENVAAEVKNQTVESAPETKPAEEAAKSEAPAKPKLVAYFKGIEITERRKALRDLCNKLKEENPGETRVNKLLIDFYKKQCNAIMLMSIEDWNKQGKRVRKGSVPFLIWDKMRDSTADTEEAAKAEGRERRKFLPMKFVYDVRQVYAATTNNTSK